LRILRLLSTLYEKGHMDRDDQVYKRYQQLQRYVAWSENDVQRLRAMGELVAPHLPALVDDFYAEIERNPDARNVITGGRQQAERLKATLLQWLRDLFSGEYDQAFALRHWRIGVRHVEIGLPEVFVIVALSRMRNGLIRALENEWLGNQADLHKTIRSLNRLLDLVLAKIDDSYQDERIRREQQHERLVTLGKIAGGIAHEVRNPLGVIKNAVYFLKTCHGETDEDTRESFAEIERALSRSNRIITELLDFARGSEPQHDQYSLGDAVAAAIADTNIPATIDVTPPEIPDPVFVRGDHEQIERILMNLIRNAVQAMPDGGSLSVSCTCDDENVVIEVTDTGEGIADGDIDKIFEPLYSRKAKGIGLGLAVSKRYAELNQGQLDVESKLGHGSTFRLSLPLDSE